MKPKYLMVFLFCLLGLCLYLFYMIYSGAKENAITELNNRQRIHAKQAKSGIESLFSDLITYLTKVSNSDHIITLDGQGINELGFALNLYSEAITAITRVDTTGRITHTIPDNAAVIGQDISSQKHIKKILITRKPVISDVFKAVQGYRAIALHVPVFKDNEFRGTLGVLINFLTIPKRFLQDIQVGESGYSWMTSKEGIEIYCSVPGHTGKSVFENYKDFPDILSMANRMVQGEEGIASYTVDQIKDQQRKTVKNHAVYLPVKIVDSFWTIVVVSSENEVLASLISLKNKLIMVVCLLLFVSSLFSYSSMKAWGIVREAAKRQKAEKALEESEKKYTSIFENAVEGFFQSTPEGQFLVVNPAFAGMFGYASPEELITHIVDIATQYYVTPEDRIQYQQLLQKTGYIEHFEFKARCKDGSQIWVSNTARACFDQDGKIIRYEGTVQDITARKLAEKALLESEYKLLTHLQNTSIGAISWDMNFKIVAWNPAAETIFGYTKEEALGKHSAGLILPEDMRGFVDGIFQDLLSGKGGSHSINENITKDGRRITCDWYNTALKDADGKVVGITALVNDITERMQIEEALQESEKKYRTILESIEDGYYEVDMKGNFTFFNDSMCKILGYSKDELTGLNNRRYMDEENAKEVFKTFNRVYKTGQPYKAIDWELIRKDGSRCYVETSVALKRHSKGQPIGFQGIARDISDRKKIEEEKIVLEKWLRQSQKMESIGVLAGGIAHDFNNILFPVLGYTEMLLEEVSEDNPFRNRLNKIYTSALRAKNLVKQILTFSRQESSELMLIKLQPVVKEALKLIRSTIPTTIEIIQEINPDCGVIKADPTQIHQVVMNLATNAYHAMEETGGALKVSLKQVELGEYDIIIPDMTPGVYACLTVADTGVGMDKSLTQKIFDPFFTTKTTGKGTGMGLSVVHGIVMAMGGAIHVYSEPGKGTQFHVYFPIEKHSFEEQNTQAKDPIQGGSEQILLVDDEEAILTMEKQMLERLGYQVTSRTSSIEALDTFCDNPDKFDLVITDMAMPNMSGDKLSVELTKIRSAIPVLLCTGFSETMSEEKAASLGIKGFLLKPIVMKDLAQKIRDVLDKDKN